MQLKAIKVLMLLLTGGCNQFFGLDAAEELTLDGSPASDAPGNILIDAYFDSSTDAEIDAFRCSGYIPMAVATTWSDATVQCETIGAKLVSIESSQENSSIRALISGSIHLGLHHDGSAFVWPNGIVPTYTNWAPGQPDGQSCVAMAADGAWYDLDCGAELAYVCEC